MRIGREDPIESEGVSIELYFIRSVNDSLVVATRLYSDQHLN